MPKPANEQKAEGLGNQDHATILVLDYGSQYTQLICRRIRDVGMFSVMFPGDASMVRAGPACTCVCGRETRECLPA